MAIWDDLSIALARLADQDPRPLTRWPQPGSRQDQPPPFHIGLAAWATAAAEELHQRFGADVELTVGALRYPQRTPAGSLGQPGRAALPQLDPAQLRVALDGPLSVPSGHRVRHGLLVTNMTSRTAEIDTSGSLIADVVDPRTGAVIGGYSGLVHTMLKTFSVAAGQTATVPLLVATDSFLPDLGYAIPAGDRGVQAILDPALGQAGRTPILPITVQPSGTTRLT
jgi:hypothetical protein